MQGVFFMAVTSENGAFSRLGTFDYVNGVYTLHDRLIGLSQEEIDTYNSIPVTDAQESYRISALKDRFPQYADPDMYDPPELSDELSPDFRASLQRAMDKMSVYFKLSDPLYLASLDSHEVDALVKEGNALGVDKIVQNTPDDPIEQAAYLNTAFSNDPAMSALAMETFMNQRTADGKHTYRDSLRLAYGVLDGQISVDQISDGYYYVGDEADGPSEEQPSSDEPSSDSPSSDEPSSETPASGEDEEPDSSSGGESPSQGESSGGSTWENIGRNIGSLFSSAKNVIVGIALWAVNKVKTVISFISQKNHADKENDADTSNQKDASDQSDRTTMAESVVNGGSSAGSDNYEPD